MSRLGAACRADRRCRAHRSVVSRQGVCHASPRYLCDWPDARRRPEFQLSAQQRNSLPGNTIVLHPDEAHDGQAGTDEGFRYRMIYIEPALFQEVLGGRALPFLEGGVTTDPRLAAATARLLQHVGYTLEPLEQGDALAELAHALAAVAGTPYDARKATSSRRGAHATICTRTARASLRLTNSKRRRAAIAGASRTTFARSMARAHTVI